MSLEVKMPEKHEIWPFLIAASCGCISGHTSEWPQLKPAIRWAVYEIQRLEKELQNANKSKSDKV